MTFGNFSHHPIDVTIWVLLKMIDSAKVWTIWVSQKPNRVISSHTWFHLYILVHHSVHSNIDVPWFPGSRNLSVLYQMVDDYIPNMTLYLPPFRPLWSLTWLRFVFGFALAKDNFIATLTKHYGEIFPTYPNVPRPEMSVGWELTCRPQSEELEKRRCYQKWVSKNTTSVGLFGGGSSQTWWFFYCSLMKSCRLFTYIINIYLYISKLYK